jgi:hypothetical protein
MVLESKQRVEESHLERDKAMLKEQQLVGKVTRLEQQLRDEDRERNLRSDRVCDSLRAKHRAELERLKD